MKDKAAEYVKETTGSDDPIRIYQAFRAGQQSMEDDKYGRIVLIGAMLGIVAGLMVILVYGLISGDPNFK